MIEFFQAFDNLQIFLFISGLSILLIVFLYNYFSNKRSFSDLSNVNLSQKASTSSVESLKEKVKVNQAATLEAIGQNDSEKLYRLNAELNDLNNKIRESSRELKTSNSNVAIQQSVHKSVASKTNLITDDGGLSNSLSKFSNYSVGELFAQQQILINETQELVQRSRDLKYRSKVAEAQNDFQQLNLLNAEDKVLSEMIKEKNNEIQSLSFDIESKQTSHKKDAFIASSVQFIAGIAVLFCFLMPSFGAGLIYVIFCFIIGAFAGSIATDSKAYAAGISVSEWKQRKDQIKDDIRQRNFEREELAKSIAEHLRK